MVKKLLINFIPAMVYAFIWLITNNMKNANFIHALLALIYIVFEPAFVIGINTKFIAEKKISFFQSIINMILTIQSHVLFLWINNVIYEVKPFKHSFYYILFWSFAILVLVYMYIYNKRVFKKSKRTLEDQICYHKNNETLFGIYLIAYILMYFHENYLAKTLF